ncbi:Mur ligase domain-containing protein [Schnuerera ultunensis]|nr:Mur ligase domain-containing protein [Schnuerera ultunensis]
MIKRKLKDIELMVKGLGLKREYEDIYIEGVSTDSRTIGKGQLFIPLIGENFNGHSFIEQAIKKGAIASLWDKSQPIPELDFPFILVEDTLIALQQLAKEYREQLNVKVIGITGSNGKTTTKDIIASILSTKYKTKKTKGNYNNLIGAPLTLLELDE